MVKYIKEEVPVKVVVEKIIEIPKIVEKIKEVRVNVDKIIEKMVEVPKVVEVEKIVEKIVEKDKVVALPTQNERSLKMELTLSLLVEQLIVELKRVKREQPNLNLQLEDDVKLIFFTELDSSNKLVGEEFNAKLKSFSDSVYRKF